MKFNSRLHQKLIVVLIWWKRAIIRDGFHKLKFSQKKKKKTRFVFSHQSSLCFYILKTRSEYFSSKLIVLYIKNLIRIFFIKTHCFPPYLNIFRTSIVFYIIKTRSEYFYWKHYSFCNKKYIWTFSLKKIISSFIVK